MKAFWPLTLRGTGAAVLAIACFILANEAGIPELQYFGMLLVGVLVAALVAVYLIRRADSVVRTLSTVVASVGRTSTITMHVGVRTAIPSAPGKWVDTLPRTLTGSPHGVFPALGSGLRGGERTVTLHYEVRGVKRGVTSIGPLRITSTDPFGLVRRRHIVAGKTEVTVVPAIVDLPALTNNVGEAGGILHSTTSQLGQGADNLIARPYLPGDSMRRIHWRATAHRDELMVRQEEQETTPEATVVFDRSVRRWTSESMKAPGTDEGFEAAVSACVSVVARLAREGYTVHIIDSDGTPLAEPIEGADLGEVDALLVRFAGILSRRDDHLHLLAPLFTGVSTGPVVLIVGRFDAADVEVVAPVAHHSSMPALFAVSPSGDALERAARTGWRVAVIDPEADLARAWVAVTERGVSSVVR
jgi:uncharacterized protein (DUF58 family)